MKRIGILGGTFDPPHIGHLIMAEEARIQMELDEIWWLPNKIPPHKHKDSDSTEEDRLKMVEMMIQLHESFSLCDIELKRDGPSYTVDSVAEIIKSYPNNTFYFIIGEDSLYNLHKWNRSEELQEMISFIVMPRPGYNPDLNTKIVSSTMLDSHTLDVSSTNIRKSIENNKLNRFLVTRAVYEYIEERKLYE